MTCFRLNAAGHHMPHILCAFHEPFRHKILLPSLFRFAGFSSICVSFSYPKIYITHCIYRLLPSPDTAFKLRSMLPEVEAGLVQIAADERWNAFGLMLSSPSSHRRLSPGHTSKTRCHLELKGLHYTVSHTLNQHFLLLLLQLKDAHKQKDVTFHILIVRSLDR